MSKISQKTRVIIYIAIAIAIIVIGAMAVLSQKSGGESLLGEKLELGQQYLLELSYDKAVLEFTDAINIEPKSADAYIGLAEAYKGLGDTEKARETLEKGYELTGDERIKALLEELDKAEEIAETTTAETTTTEITAEETTAPPSRKYTDDELVEAVKLLIKDPDANVDQAMLDKMTSICIFGEDIVVVNNFIQSVRYNPENKSFDFFSEIEGESYQYGNITDISFIKRLKNIREFGCDFNQISDISVLSGLTNLESLSLIGNQISDISSLSGLTNLTKLYLGDNQINDISSLSGLKDLEGLQLGTH